MEKRFIKFFEKSENFENLVDNGSVFISAEKKCEKLQADGLHFEFEHSLIFLILELTRTYQLDQSVQTFLFALAIREVLEDYLDK